MSRRKELYVLGGLIVLLIVFGYYYFQNGNQAAGPPSLVAADVKFQPLDVQEPQLRLDLLEKIRKIQYLGSHRNIFTAAPPPIPEPTGPAVIAQRPFVGPKVPLPPPPLQIPAELFGYSSQPHGGRRVAFFTSGDDVLVVAEGGTFLSRFRLDRINNDSADVEEISTGRHAIVPMVQAPDPGASPGTPQ
jgi:hypothetical protein